MDKKKYRVGVRPMTDQTDAEFRAALRKPRTKVFVNDDAAYEYFWQCRELAKKESFEAYMTEYHVEGGVK